MLSKYKYRNWKKNYPNNLLEYIFSPCIRGLLPVNFVFQKILRLNCKVKFMVHFTSQVSGTIIIGKGVAQSFANSGGCYIQAINGVVIGDYSIFASGVKIISANHVKGNLNEHEKLPPLKIGSNCWLGANSVLLPGIELKDNVIVGAGCVVTKSFGPNVVIAGNPAKIIKELN